MQRGAAGCDLTGDIQAYLRLVNLTLTASLLMLISPYKTAIFDGKLIVGGCYHSGFIHILLIVGSIMAPKAIS